MKFKMSETPTQKRCYALVLKYPSQSVFKKKERKKEKKNTNCCSQETTLTIHHTRHLPKGDG